MWYVVDVERSSVCSCDGNSRWTDADSRSSATTTTRAPRPYILLSTMGHPICDNGNHGFGHGNIQSAYAGSTKTPDNRIVSPFLYFASSLPSADSSKLVLDLPVTPYIRRSKRARSRGFSVASDSKAFYTTISVREIQPEEMQEETSPRKKKSEKRPSTPVREVHAKGLVQTPPDLPDYETPSAESPDQQDIKEDRRHTTPISGKRHRPGSRTAGSRSSSAARRKSGGQARHWSGSYSLIRGPGSKPARDLVAFHRDACRLFESFDREQLPVCRPKLKLDTSAETLDRRRAHTDPADHDVFLDDFENPPSPRPDPVTPSLPRTRHDSWDPSNAATDSDGGEHQPERKLVEPTVFEWTSPTSRRREYAKIDRSTRGLRGVWRKVAPKFLLSEQHAPFFEEGKTGRDYEGSVRRFRMDIPDDGEDQNQDPRSFKRTGTWIGRKLAAVREKPDKVKSLRHWPLRRRHTES